MIVIAWEDSHDIESLEHLSVVEGASSPSKLVDFVSPDDWVLFIPSSFSKSFWLDDTNSKEITTIVENLPVLKEKVETYDWIMMQWKPNCPSSKLQKTWIETVEGLHGDDLEKSLHCDNSDDNFHFPPDKWTNIRKEWTEGTKYPWEPGFWFMSRLERGVEFVMNSNGKNANYWVEEEKKLWNEWMYRYDDLYMRQGNPGSWHGVQNDIDWPHSLLTRLRKRGIMEEQWYKGINVGNTITFFIHGQYIHRFCIENQNETWDDFFNGNKNEVHHGAIEIDSWDFVRRWWSEKLGLMNRDIWNELVYWEEIWKPTYQHIWAPWRNSGKTTSFLWSPLQNEFSTNVLQENSNSQTREFLDFQNRSIPDKLRITFLDTLGGNDSYVSVYRTSSISMWNYSTSPMGFSILDHLNFVHLTTRTHFVLSWIWDYFNMPFLFNSTIQFNFLNWYAWIKNILRKCLGYSQYYLWNNRNPVIFIAISESGWQYFRKVMHLLVSDHEFQGIIWWPLVGYPIYTNGKHSTFEVSSSPPIDWIEFFGTNTLEKTPEFLETLGEVPSPLGYELKARSVDWMVPKHIQKFTGIKCETEYGFYVSPRHSSNIWRGYSLDRMLDGVDLEAWCLWIRRRLRDNLSAMKWCCDDIEIEMSPIWVDRLSRTGFPFMAVFEQGCNYSFEKHGWGGHSWNCVSLKSVNTEENPPGFVRWIRNILAPNVRTWKEGITFWRQTGLPFWIPVLFS